MQYRPDIDGLRAVAVLPVVLFHAGSQTFSGGFVGVDIFFVISGYLIGGIIAEEIRQGRFTILNFYERRIRRLFPALFTVIACSAVVASFVFMPADFRDFGESAAAATLFVANILFWQEAGYFDTPAAVKPLLHTWSLSVEEQFYLVFPLFMIIVHRWLKGRWVQWLLPVLVLSFALSAWGAIHKPSSTFYLAPTRAWELLTGVLLALGLLAPIGRRWLREALALAGVALIAWAVLRFDAHTAFPGVNALFPVLGAALLIHTGCPDTGMGGTIVSRLLSWQPLVLTGLISYSLYLWHWPLIVFAGYINIHPLSNLQMSLVVLLSIGLAVLSWRYVERPFRSRTRITARPLFAGAVTAMAVLVVIGGMIAVTQGWPGRFPPQVQMIAAVSAATDPRSIECKSFLSGEGRTEPCIYGAPAAPRTAVWGDSHANALIPGIAAAAERHGEAVAFLGADSCRPVFDVYDGRVANTECRDYNDAVRAWLQARPEITHVIVVSRWATLAHGKTGTLGPNEGYEPPAISDRPGHVVDIDTAERLAERHVRQTIDILRQIGKTVVLVYPVPEIGYDVPSTLARLVLFGEEPGSFTRPLALHRERQRFIAGVLDELGDDRIIRVHPETRLCNEQDCMVYAGGQPLYHDDDHLSLAGAAWLAPLFDPVFAAVAEAGPVRPSRSAAARP